MNKTQSTIGIFLLFSFFGLYLIYKPFLLSMAIAVLLSMATYSLTTKLAKVSGSRGLSIVISTVLLAVLFIAPLSYLIHKSAILFSETDFTQLNAQLKDFLNQGMLKDVEFLQNSSSMVNALKDYSAHFAEYGTKGLGFVKDIVLILIFFTLSHIYGMQMLEFFNSLLPVSKIHLARLFLHVSATMEVVFYSILVTAVFEGALFALITWFYDLDYIMLGVLYGFASLIPVVGGALMWIPVSLYVWYEIDAASAIIIALYSVVVISIIADTFIKPVIIKGINAKLRRAKTDINEILIFFAIVAGLTTFGFWGMIIGPAITSLFIALAKLYVDVCNNKL